MFLLGAVNRVKSALNEWKKSHDSLPHYVVGLEVFVIPFSLLFRVV